MPMYEFRLRGPAARTHCHAWAVAGYLLAGSSIGLAFQSVPGNAGAQGSAAQLVDKFSQESPPAAASDDLGSVFQQAATDAYYTPILETGGAFGDVPVLQAPNSAHSFRTYFVPQGIEMDSLGGEWTFALSLVSWGYGDAQSAVELAASITPSANRAILDRGEMVEWYENAPDGLKQTFFIAAPPGENTENELLVLRMDLGGDLVVDAERSSPDCVTLTLPDGEPALSYYGLASWDALGRPLTGLIQLEAGQIVIQVDDSDALYPITIDPFLATLTYTFTARDENAGDGFGTAIAVDNDLAVVGAPGADGPVGVDQGAVYLIRRNPTANTWHLAGKFYDPNADEYARFGSAVAAKGDYFFVGAPDADPLQTGKVVAFRRSPEIDGAVTAYRTFVGGSLSRYGAALAFDGSWLAIGAPGSTSGNPNKRGGQAFFLSWTASTISNSSQPVSVPYNSLAGDQFGAALALKSPRLAVGAPRYGQIGRVVEYSLSGVSATQIETIWPIDGAVGDQFGAALSYGELPTELLIGSPGRDRGEVQDTGSVTLRRSAPPNVATKLEFAPGTLTTGDAFGSALFYDHGYLYVGTPGDDTGSFFDTGSVYRYFRTVPSNVPLYTQQSVLSIPSQGGQRAGASLAGYWVNGGAAAGTHLLVGAPANDSHAADQGAVLPMRLNGTTVQSFAAVRTTDRHAGDRFGTSVCLNGFAFIGESADDGASGTDQGSVFIYSQDSRRLVAMLTPLTPPGGASVAGANFGAAIASDYHSSGQHVAIGAPGLVDGRVFTFTIGASGLVKPTGSPLPGGGLVSKVGFGAALSMNAGRLAIGAPYWGLFKNPGFVRIWRWQPTALAWVSEATLNYSLGPSNDAASFGSSVCLDANELWVGAPGADYTVGATTTINAGQVRYYVFTAGEGPWTLWNTYRDPTPAANENYGASVKAITSTIPGSLQSGRLAVGVPGSIEQGKANAGCVRVYREPFEGPWVLSSTLLSMDVVIGQRFGSALDLETMLPLQSHPEGHTLIAVGAPGSTANTTQSNAYIYRETSNGAFLADTRVKTGVDATRYSLGTSLDLEGFECSGSRLILIGVPLADFTSAADAGRAELSTITGLAACDG